MTAKLCRLGVRLVEAPISYHPRGASAGKKIGWRDAVQTVWTLLQWRFLPLGDAMRVGRTVWPAAGLQAAAKQPVIHPPHLPVG